MYLHANFGQDPTRVSLANRFFQIKCFFGPQMLQAPRSCGPCRPIVKPLVGGSEMYLHTNFGQNPARGFFANRVFISKFFVSFKITMPTVAVYHFHSFVIK